MLAQAQTRVVSAATAIVQRQLLELEQREQERFQHTVQAFWDLVDKKEEGSCWVWLGCTTERYGVFTRFHRFVGRGAFQRRETLVHRISWVLTNGQPPADKPCVRHWCESLLCCNPTHLYVGLHGRAKWS